MNLFVDSSCNLSDCNKITHEYYCQEGRYARPHLASAHSRSNSSANTSSEGMVNYSNSCWMIAVLQALRASPSFRLLLAPTYSEQNQLKEKLFQLFAIVEGKNGQRKRPVSHEEIRLFKALLIKEGLPVTMNSGYFEEPFLQFLLKKLNPPTIDYHYSSSHKEKSEHILTLPLKESSSSRQLQTLVQARKIAFKTSHNVPEFLPLYLDRPLIKKRDEHGHSVHEFSRVSIVPSTQLIIPVKREGRKAKFSLVSIVIGRDSAEHAYCYTIERDIEGRMIWVEYDDQKVLTHPYPDNVKRRPNSNQTPFQDACKHAGILIYQFIGYESED